MVGVKNPQHVLNFIIPKFWPISIEFTAIGLNNQSTLVLVEKLAEAIETDKPERANAIAIILASHLGYNNYRQLLKDIRGNISTAIPRR